MSKKIETNQKHMNQDNRVVIEKGLDASKPLSTIAAELGKDPTTIAKEINNHPFSNNDCPASAIAFLNMSTDMPASFAPRSTEISPFSTNNIICCKRPSVRPRSMPCCHA